MRKPPPRKPHWIEDRLAQLPNKNKKGLAIVLDLEPARISEIINGKRQIKISEIKPIAEYLEWPDNVVYSLSTGTKVEILPITHVYVVGEVQAGSWKEALRWEASSWYQAPIMADARYRSLEQFGLRVAGPSMNEVYPEGSVVVCVNLKDLGREPRPGERVIVQRQGPTGLVEITVKELRRDEAGDYWLWPRSTHPAFQQPWKWPPPLDEHVNEDIQVVALVIGSYRPEA